MSWTGFGGEWHDGVHSGGDDSGSIGGGGIKLDGYGNPVGTRSPNASDIAAQFNSYGGTQISASQVSNIRSNGDGSYSADISGESHTVSSGGSSTTGNTVGGFTGVGTPQSNGGTGLNGGVSNWNDAATFIRAGTIPPNFKLEGGKIGIMTPIYRESGVGHGTQIDVFTGKYKFVEVPSLTATYKEGLKERAEYAAAIKVTADFFKELGAKFGAQQATIAQELAASAKGQPMYNVDRAMAAFTKSQAIIDANLDVGRRTMAAHLIESQNREAIAAKLKTFGKTFGYVSMTMDGYDLAQSLSNAIKTGDWRSFFVKAEALLLARDASVIAAWAFSLLLGSPINIMTYVIIMAAVSALVNEDLVNKFVSLIQ